MDKKETIDDILREIEEMEVVFANRIASLPDCEMRDRMLADTQQRQLRFLDISNAIENSKKLLKEQRDLLRLMMLLV